MSAPTLRAKLARLIESNGPVSVADYMALCLGDPEHGYYITRDRFGAAGDFTTAPEISQMFGEIVGAWLVQAWRLAGGPTPLRLVELGPGRGTLMADVLRVARLDPALMAAASLHLVETSPTLRTRQAETLARAPLRPAWHDRLEAVPDGPLLLVANEFFDALPVRQFVRAEGTWRERVVGLSPDGALCFGLGTRRLAHGPEAPDGSLVEVAPAREAVAGQIGRRIASHGGAALVIDYGYSVTAYGETLQAVRAHEYADPLADPGEADLTAHVDFAALTRAAEAEGARCHGPMPQGEFLTSLGLGERAARLKAGKDAARAADLDAAAERLTSPAAMGTLFKAVAITRRDMAPAPFDSVTLADGV